jgi:hypothetical protein
MLMAKSAYNPLLKYIHIDIMGITTLANHTLALA